MAMARRKRFSMFALFVFCPMANGVYRKAHHFPDNKNPFYVRTYRKMGLRKLACASRYRVYNVYNVYLPTQHNIHIFTGRPTLRPPSSPKHKYPHNKIQWHLLLAHLSMVMQLVGLIRLSGIQSKIPIGFVRMGIYC